MSRSLCVSKEEAERESFLQSAQFQEFILLHQPLVNTLLEFFYYPFSLKEELYRIELWELQLSFSEAKGNTFLMQMNSCELHYLV